MPTKTVSCNDEDWMTCDIVGSLGAVVQMSTQGTIRLYMGSEQPSIDDITGIILGQKIDGVAISNIPTGEELYIRAVESEHEQITIIYG